MLAKGWWEQIWRDSDQDPEWFTQTGVCFINNLTELPEASKVSQKHVEQYSIAVYSHITKAYLRSLLMYFYNTNILYRLNWLDPSNLNILFFTVDTADNTRSG